MYQPVAQHREDGGQQPDPVLEYAMAVESEDPWALNRVLKKYDGQDDLMVAFLAVAKKFNDNIPYTEQLRHYRETNQLPARQCTPLIIPDAQGISHLGHVTYRVWRFISRAWGK